LAVKILTNCHNLLRNPLHWPLVFVSCETTPKKNWDWTIFFLNGWTVGHCHTSPGGSPDTRARWY
jgi:hypothetical protein